MPNLIEGHLHKPEGHFVIVAARFNSMIVEMLEKGAIDALLRHGVSDEHITVVRVPGSFELPLVAKRVADSHKPMAIICLGAVIKGDTDHYDHVAGGTTSGIGRVGLDAGIPVIFGVLTCDTLEQAINRAGGKAGNKGYEAAVTAIEMVNLMKQLG
jgi:6,7-dimethyl-8-ribityllumazine synthase